MSPLVLPFFAAGSLLSIAELPEAVVHTVPQAFYVWLGIGVVAMLWLSWRLWAARKAVAGNVLALPPLSSHEVIPRQTPIRVEVVACS